MPSCAFAKSRDSLERMPTYKTHDNGSVPFIVKIDAGKSKATVFKQIFDEKKDAYVGKEEILEFKIKDYWAGKKSSFTKASSWELKWKGNSVLLLLAEGSYVFVGGEVYSFKTEKGETILDYFSDVGNNDVPYPYAVGENNVYLMIENVFVPKAEVNLKEEVYGQFYGSKALQKGAKKMKRKVLQKRWIF